VLVLTVEGEESRSERAQVGGGCGATGDEGRGTSRFGRDPAGENDLLAGRQPVGELAQRRVGEDPVRDLEGPLDPSFRCAGADDPAPRATAEEQVQ
jgi:hypothetical protein